MGRAVPAAASRVSTSTSAARTRTSSATETAVGSEKTCPAGEAHWTGATSARIRSGPCEAVSQPTSTTATIGTKSEVSSVTAVACHAASATNNTPTVLPGGGVGHGISTRCAVSSAAASAASGDEERVSREDWNGSEEAESESSRGERKKNFG